MPKHPSTATEKYYAAGEKDGVAVDVHMWDLTLRRCGTQRQVAEIYIKYGTIQVRKDAPKCSKFSLSV